MDKHADKRATIDLTDIRPLSDFQRNTKAHIKRLKKSGLATVLTVNGRASVVVQDAECYQRILLAAERAEIMEAALQGVSQAETGQTETLAAFDKRIRRKHGFVVRSRK
jgi:hypothetical protein